MKYLSLDPEEIKELRSILNGILNRYFIILLIGVGLCYFISEIIFRDEFLQKNLALGMSLIFIFALLLRAKEAGLPYIVDLIKKEKKVHVGVISGKTRKYNGVCYIYMDGTRYLVKESHFNLFNQGDIAEIHTSPKSKEVLMILKHKNS